jgi:CDGSH-type Zn-finger protein
MEAPDKLVLAPNGHDGLWADIGPVMAICSRRITKHEKGEREEFLRKHGQYALSRSGTELVIHGAHARAGTPAKEAAIRDPNLLFNYQAMEFHPMQGEQAPSRRQHQTRREARPPAHQASATLSIPPRPSPTAQTSPTSATYTTASSKTGQRTLPRLSSLPTPSPTSSSTLPTHTDPSTSSPSQPTRAPGHGALPAQV